jgi:saccharopine dehydrogenase-like NADP-dependent oxidoreductase
MNVVVLGAAGLIGREVAATIARRGSFDRVVLADRQRTPLRRVASTLGDGVEVREVDATDQSSLTRVLKGNDVLVNCTTYHLGVRLLTAAVRADVHYVDLGGLYNTPRQLEMADRVARAGITAVIGCGATPGVTNVLARWGAEGLDRAERVEIAFASFRDLAASPGLLDTILDEFRPEVPRFYWRDGEFVPTVPFEGRRRVHFPAPVGAQDVFYVPHSETHTIHRFLPGVREVAVRGTWRPADMDRLKAVASLGLTGEQPVSINGKKVAPLQVLREVLLAHAEPTNGEPWAFFLWVSVRGRRKGRRREVRMTASHPSSWGTATTGRMTGIPAALGAEMIASGRVTGVGVRPPEAAFEPADFLNELRGEGLTFRRRIVP